MHLNFRYCQTTDGRRRIENIAELANQFDYRTNKNPFSLTRLASSQRANFSSFGPIAKLGKTSEILRRRNVCGRGKSCSIMHVSTWCACLIFTRSMEQFHLGEAHVRVQSRWHVTVWILMSIDHGHRCASWLDASQLCVDSSFQECFWDFKEISVLH